MSSRQRGQNKRRHDYLSSCIHRVGVLGGRCQHWSEEIRRESTDASDQKDPLSLPLRCTANRLQEFSTFVIHTTKGHSAKSLDNVRFHVFTLERVPMHLPQPFNSDVQKS